VKLRERTCGCAGLSCFQRIGDMPLTPEYLNAVGAVADQASGPMIIPWPMPGNLGGFVSFDNFARWRDFVVALSLPAGIPLVVSAKYERAQKLFLFGWIDADLMKAGELVALTTLELALKDRYGGKVRKDKNGNFRFADLLRYMPQRDGLTDDLVPMNQRCGGGSVVDLLTGKRKPSLAQIRNDMAHGYPFDGFPWSGLLELVRDLMGYAYRDITSQPPPPLAPCV
jgi:hypothetical protein